MRKFMLVLGAVIHSPSFCAEALSLPECLSETMETAMSFIPPEDLLLRTPSFEVPQELICSKETQSIIDLMLHLASAHQIDRGHGVMVGLAAPQIGIPQRIILVDIGVDSECKKLGNVEAYINPEIIWYSEEISWGIEGCYSVDSHLDGKIPRSESIHVLAFDRNGNRINQKFSGFTARIFQHEVDHLNGIRFPDRVGEHGELHWIPDNQNKDYSKNWGNWPLKCPWSTWLDMKEGRPYKTPLEDLN